MEFSGRLHKQFVQKRINERKAERSKYASEAARLLFAMMHLKLELSAPAEEYERAMKLAVENARKLSQELFPDWSEKELQDMWKSFIGEGN